MDLLHMWNLWPRPHWAACEQGSAQLQANLRGVTEVGLDAPKEDVLAALAQASHDPDQRWEIMRHLQDCLAEPTRVRWRRIHGGLTLLDVMLRRGAPALVADAAQGLHFDAVQRLTFLQQYEYADDRRVELLIRQKASALRHLLLEKLAVGDVGGSTVSVTSVASVAKSPPTPQKKPEKIRARRKKGVIQGIVVVGHDDSTSDDGSGSETSVPAPETRRRQHASGETSRSYRTAVGTGGYSVVFKQHEDSTDSADSDREGEACFPSQPREEASAATAVNHVARLHTVDLLGI
ncbi:unnamed protein product [Polarella glacialis]|uniref:ENTH domain-containing protein n=1 Tax=Polarella glacialis TaxID=89957 RepID=A0A813DGE8_POLGL|nr:unnamed protein product [Polarella glacialis]CAE8647035.1 unnamed protein product [Polarella glacialis]